MEEGPESFNNEVSREMATCQTAIQEYRENYINQITMKRLNTRSILRQEKDTRFKISYSESLKYEKPSKSINYISNSASVRLI